jgi:hypothetical protein
MAFIKKYFLMSIKVKEMNEDINSTFIEYLYLSDGFEPRATASIGWL